jgi:hypothetical protein
MIGGARTANRRAKFARDKAPVTRSSQRQDHDICRQKMTTFFVVFSTLEVSRGGTTPLPKTPLAF